MAYEREQRQARSNESVALPCYFGWLVESPPGVPGAGMVLITASLLGGLTRISGSTPVGGQITPFVSARRSLVVLDGDCAPGAEEGGRVSSWGQGGD